MASSTLLHVLLFLLLGNAIESRKMFEKQPIIYTDKQNIIYTKQPIIYTDKQNIIYTKQPIIYTDKQNIIYTKQPIIYTDKRHIIYAKHPIIYTGKQSIIYTENSPKASSFDDPSEMIFFLEKDLKPGNKIPIYFPKYDPAKSPRFLPRNEAASVPFSSKQLADILTRFSVSPSSPQAEAMEYTITTCEAEPVEGETRTCARSKDSMLDFVATAFGSDEKPRVVSTSMISSSGAGMVWNYTVMGAPVDITARKMVACHTLPYPYAVYYCHFQKGGRKVYKVALAGPSGGGVDVDALAVCHLDTTHWPRDHAAFRVLGIEPGMLPVCHFFPADNLVWLPAPVLQG